MAERRDVIAKVLAAHILHASINICTGCDWRALSRGGSLAEQHRAHLADAINAALPDPEQAVSDALASAADDVEQECTHQSGPCFCGSANWLRARAQHTPTPSKRPECNWPRCNSPRLGKCFAWCKCRCHTPTPSDVEATDE